MFTIGDKLINLWVNDKMLNTMYKDVISDAGLLFAEPFYEDDRIRTSGLARGLFVKI